MFQSFNDDDSDVVRLLLSATDAAEEEVDVTAGNDRYTPSFIFFWRAKALEYWGPDTVPEPICETSDRNVKTG